jgi:hypothetical protein
VSLIRFVLFDEDDFQAHTDALAGLRDEAGA